MGKSEAFARAALRTIAAFGLLAILSFGAYRVEQLSLRVAKFHVLAQRAMSPVCALKCIKELNAQAVHQTGHPLFMLARGLSSTYRSHIPWENCTIVQSGLPGVDFYRRPKPPIVACSTLSVYAQERFTNVLRKASRAELVRELANQATDLSLPFWS